MRKPLQTIALVACIVSLAVSCKQSSTVDPADTPAVTDTSTPTIPTTPTESPVAVAHTITFAASGGSGTMAAQSILEGQAASLTANAFVNQGYYFAGWSTGVAGSALIADGATYTMGASDMTLIAVWSVNPAYTITFDSNGGAGTMAAQAIVSGLSANLAANAYTRAGYTFAGWATSKGGAAVYADCANFAMGSAPVTLWATWCIKPSHALRFDAAGGTGVMAEVMIVEDLSATIPANAFTKSGCRFAGWATTSGGPVAYASGDALVMGTADATLYAVWLRWTTFLEGNNTALAVATDHDGHLVVVGYGKNLNGVTQKGIFDGFLRKYDRDGTILWTVSLGGKDCATTLCGIAIDTDGNSYVCGSVDSNVTGSKVEGQPCVGKRDFIVAKISPNGVVLWTRLLGVAETYTDGRGISVDSAGICYLTGFTQGRLDGQDFSAGEYSYEAFLCSFDTLGNKRWTRLLGAQSRGNAVAIDSGGAIFITGEIERPIEGRTLTGYCDLFVGKYDKDGNRSLITLLGAPSSQTFPYGIDFDDGGDFFVCGMTSGNLGDELHSGIRDMFVSRFSNSGVMKWTRLLGASGGDVWAKDICVDASGSIYVTGYTPNDLGDQVRIGSQDAFVVKYLPTGSREWIRLIGGTGGNASANGICCNKDDGTLTVAGCALKVFDGYPIPGLFSAGFLTTRFTP